MSSTTVRISSGTHRALREIAEKRGQSMQTVLDEAVEQLRRQTFFDDFDRAYAAVREDPQAWADEIELRKALDATLGNALEDDE
jgi:predicted transcriptional regulator